MAAPSTLALHARDDRTRTGFEAAAERQGMDVVLLTDQAASLTAIAAPGVAIRAPGGLVAHAIALGSHIRLAGPSPAWFVGLDTEITGRSWQQLTSGEARELVSAAPTFVKLADAKHPAVPARRYHDIDTFDAAMTVVGSPPQLQLLATSRWLDIDSEYRVFTRRTDVLTTSPYRVQDEPWTPLLHTHRASFHVEAAEFVDTVLRNLAPADVPPAAALDVARLSNGRLVLLEANNSWAAGLYGCDPFAAFEAVLAANDPNAADGRWLWTPDPAIVALITARHAGERT